jgi:hypothetical protein
VERCCEHDDEPADFHESGGYIYYVNYRFLKKDSA